MSTKLIIYALAVMVTLGCGGTLDVELLEVEGTPETRLELGQSVSLFGTGFFSGRHAAVRFIGVMKRPGLAERNVRATVPGLALSTDELSFDITPDLLEAIGGRGTFHGEVWVSFDTAMGDGVVSGVWEPAVLNFVPGATDRLADEIAMRGRAMGLERRLGLTLQENPLTDGLVVLQATPGGQADNQGIGVGDRVEMLSGLMLDSRSDFVPSPADTTVSLQVIRSGEVEPRLLSFDLGTTAGTPERSYEKYFGVGLAAACLLLFAFVAPTARWLGWLSRHLSQARWRTGWTQPLIPSFQGGDTRYRYRWGVASMLAATLITLTLGAFPLLADQIPGGADAGILILAAISCRMTVLLVARDLDPAQGGNLFTEFLLLQLPSLVFVEAVLVSSGTTRLEGVVLSQGPWPWEWLLFQQPALFLAFPCLVVASLSTALDSRRVGSWLGAVDLAFLLLMAGTVTAIACGGWAPLGSGTLGALLGVFAFVLKGWGLLLLVVYIADSRRRERAPNPWKWAVPISVLAAAVGVAWLWIELPADMPSAVGVALFGFSGVLCVYLIWRGYRAPTVTRELHVYPFL